MQKLSEKQIDTLALIVVRNGTVLLQCDGYSISVMNIGFFGSGGAHVMIDGCMNVHWLRGGYDQSKYLKPATDDMPIWMEGWQYQPYFNNAKAALEHINAASDSVELLYIKLSGQL